MSTIVRLLRAPTPGHTLTFSFELDPGETFRIPPGWSAVAWYPGTAGGGVGIIRRTVVSGDPATWIFPAIEHHADAKLREWRLGSSSPQAADNPLD